MPLTAEELEKNEIRNKNFEKISVETELIMKYYEKGGEFFETATDILCHIKDKANIILAPVHIGRALNKLGIERNKHKGIFGYWLNKKH